MLVGDFYLFELGGVGLILGVAWLATLGEVKVNWSTLTMTFLDHGKAVEVRGDPSLVKTLILLMKISRIEAVSMLWVMESSGKEVEGGDAGI